jgi:SOS response regulatory protein OraA/RecX
MSITVKTVRQSRANGEWLVSVCTETRVGERTHTYRVCQEEYEAAGEPREGDSLDEAAFRALSEREDTHRAYERALKILAAGDNTARMLEKKLRERGFSEGQAREATRRVVTAGYLKEEEMLMRQFAVFAKRLWGRGKYLPALISKGFSREMIEKVTLRAEDEGVYSADAVKKALLERFSPEGYAETKALLYKHGFR